MEVSPVQAAVHIETIGPFCPKCDSLIESCLGELRGVTKVSSTYSIGLTSVLIDLDQVDTGALTDEIRRCGFDAHAIVTRPLN
jgi:copper chaperone CopZ